jgi:GntR family negative regulator for fad regulon and positive regulator of fabA
MEWTTPSKPAELTESRLIDAILDGIFPIDSTLPGERELAQQLKVTRPTLREALQRLGRDGWLEIHQGKSTRVRDYWSEGSLGVLGTIARHSQHLPANFVTDLLYVRLVMAPAYTRLAIENTPHTIVDTLQHYVDLPDSADEFARFDWELHRQLTIASKNPVFTLILNGFKELYQPMARLYFVPPESRSSSRSFYAGLQQAAIDKDAALGESITKHVMEESLCLWKQAVRSVDHQTEKD